MYDLARLGPGQSIGEVVLGTNLNNQIDGRWFFGVRAFLPRLRVLIRGDDVCGGRDFAQPVRRYLIIQMASQAIHHARHNLDSLAQLIEGNQRSLGIVVRLPRRA